jgi:hypothetical protein
MTRDRASTAAVARQRDRMAAARASGDAVAIEAAYESGAWIRALDPEIIRLRQAQRRDELRQEAGTA